MSHSITAPITQARDAYQLAVAAGFDGTLAEWLESLVGDITPELLAAQEAAEAAASTATAAASTATTQAGIATGSADAAAGDAATATTQADAAALSADAAATSADAAAASAAAAGESEDAAAVSAATAVGAIGNIMVLVSQTDTTATLSAGVNVTVADGTGTYPSSLITFDS